MNRHPPNTIRYVQKPFSNRSVLEVIPIHGELQQQRYPILPKQRFTNHPPQPMSVISLVSDNETDSKSRAHKKYSNSKNNTEQNRSFKDTFICFQLILTTLIALGGMGLSIYLYLYLNQLARTTTQTTSTTTTTTTTMRSECSTYTTITDPTRRITTGVGTACDNAIFTLTTTWVRFSGAAGTEIVKSPPSVQQCNTQVTGWYTGLMPAYGTTTTGTVCYVSSSTSTCTYSNTISVTNCGSFYVYGLIQPPVCNARYCTN